MKLMHRWPYFYRWDREENTWKDNSLLSYLVIILMLVVFFLLASKGKAIGAMLVFPIGGFFRLVLSEKPPPEISKKYWFHYRKFKHYIKGADIYEAHTWQGLFVSLILFLAMGIIIQLKLSLLWLIGIFLIYFTITRAKAQPANK